MLLTVPEFNVRMDRLKEAGRKGILTDPAVGTLPVQSRLLVERVMKLTPAKSEDQQRHAIRNDLLNVLQILPEPVILAAAAVNGTGRINRYVHDSKRNVHVWVSGAGIGLTTSDARKFHHNNYQSRGRTRRLGGGFEDNGRRRTGYRLLVTPLVFSAYLREVYLRIGIAKAGWLPGATALHAAPAAAYVTRWSPGSGLMINGLSAPRPFIEVRNTTRWAALREEGARIVKTAIASRIRAMDTYLRRMSEIAVKKAGLS
jgi:hypothetical protein